MTKPINPKRYCSVFLVFTLLFLSAAAFFACGDNAGDGLESDRESFSTDTTHDTPTAVDFQSLCSAIDVVVTGVENYIPRDEGYLENMMMINPASYASCRVLVSTLGGSIDEYGVFEVLPGEDVSEVADSIKEYLSYYNEIWDDRYLPEEYPKLRDAKVKTYGDRFAVYAILDKVDSAALFAAADALFQ